MNNSKTKLPWANKNLGQHFLTDNNVINIITTDHIEKAQAIIEIGPGPGILTKNLAQHKCPYALIERDKRFEPYLTEWVKLNQIHFTDALEFDVGPLFTTKKWNKKKVWLVANLPYNVSVPILIKYIQEPQIELMTLMFQKEVGNKIISTNLKQKKNEMNSLMALCQNFFDIQSLCTVPSSSFFPPPKVDSIVLSMTRKTAPVIPLKEFETFEKFLRKIFAFKRKQLGTVLKTFVNKKNSSKVDKILEICHIDKKSRAETFSLNDVQKLYNEFKKLEG